MQPLPTGDKGAQIRGKISTARQKRDQRIGCGCDPLIAGWQCVLEETLIRLEAFLLPGRLVTFGSLAAHDRRQFLELHHSIILPPHVSGVYIPPSVLRGLIPGDYRKKSNCGPVHMPDENPDCGILLACQYQEYRLIINALLAPPPLQPGIDVYTEGNLSADYGFATLGECQRNMQPVIWTHLHTHVDLPSLV